MADNNGRLVGTNAAKEKIRYRKGRVHSHELQWQLRSECLQRTFRFHPIYL